MVGDDHGRNAKGCSFSTVMRGQNRRMFIQQGYERPNLRVNDDFQGWKCPRTMKYGPILNETKIWISFLPISVLHQDRQVLKQQSPVRHQTRLILCEA